MDLAGAWVLRHGSGPDGDLVVPDDARVTLHFTADEVGGQACNHYGGRYELGVAGAISFSAMGMTDMACAEPMMTVESRYHAALAAATRVARDGDRLTLTGDGAELVFELLPPVPEAALRGTHWVLESLIHVDAVASVQGDAWLELDGDGSIRGSTGCRDITGRYVVVGDRVVPTDLSAEGECTAQLEQQDGQIIEVLEGFMVELRGDRLSLTLPNGSGLEYIAVAE